MASTELSIDKDSLRARIYSVLSAQEKDAAALKEPWEPVFDSLATVEIICGVDDLVPIELAASKIVRPGGYNSSSEAAEDISNRIANICKGKNLTKSNRRPSSAVNALQGMEQ